MMDVIQAVRRLDSVSSAADEGEQGSCTQQDNVIAGKNCMDTQID